MLQLSRVRELWLRALLRTFHLAFFIGTMTLLGSNHTVSSVSLTSLCPPKRLAVAGGTAGCMPQVALGSWWITSEQAYQATTLALAAGFRHFDTAWNYGTQPGIGKALAESGVQRQELFVTSKLSDVINCTDAFADATRQIAETLHQLQLDYVDALLIHHPGGDACNFETWRALEKAHRAGQARAIGLSNFCEDQIRYLIERADVPPAINQVVMHVGIMPAMLRTVTWCQRNGIAVMGYSPLAIKFDESDELIRNDSVTGRIGRRYGRSGAEVSLRYVVQRGAAVVTQSTSVAHLRSDVGLSNWQLSGEDMAVLDAQTTPSGGFADELFGAVGKRCMNAWGMFEPDQVDDPSLF